LHGFGNSLATNYQRVFFGAMMLLLLSEIFHNANLCFIVVST
jgi:hypothetical protein